MTEENFLKSKQKLLDLINNIYQNVDLSNSEKTSLGKTLKLLEKYTYENRLEMKGTLTRTIIDSLELSYSLGEKLIEFDQCIR